MREFIFKQAVTVFLFQILQQKAIGSYCPQGSFKILRGCHKQMISVRMSRSENYK